MTKLTRKVRLSYKSTPEERLAEIASLYRAIDASNEPETRKIIIRTAVERVGPLQVQQHADLDEVEAILEAEDADLAKAKAVFERVSLRREEIQSLRNVLLAHGFDVAYDWEDRALYVARSLDWYGTDPDAPLDIYLTKKGHALAELDETVDLVTAAFERRAAQDPIERSTDSIPLTDDDRARVEREVTRVATKYGLKFADVGDYVASVAAIRSSVDLSPEQRSRFEQNKAGAIDRMFAADPSDYAPGVDDLKARLLVGYGKDYSALTDRQKDRREVDYAAFKEALDRHEYSLADIKELHEAVSAASAVATEDLERKKLEVERLERIIYGSTHRGAASHLEALEMQWTSVRFGEEQLRAIRANPREAVRLNIASFDRYAEVVATLRNAPSFAWAQMPVEAVASAAERLLPEMHTSATALGEYAAPGACGWWYFSKPIPVQTTNRSATLDPVVALLWQRSYFPEPATAFAVFTFSTEAIAGRAQLVPVQSVSWQIPDSVSLGEIQKHVEENYRGLEADADRVRVGSDAIEWFSRFFLAGMSWIRQRIVATERGQGARNIARAIQRTHKLAAPPVLSVIHLRKREVVRSEPTETDPDAPKRRLSCRFVVRGFWRNQFYSSRGEHAPKYIDSFMKGPSDAPLRETAKVYAVVR